MPDLEHEGCVGVKEEFTVYAELNWEPEEVNDSRGSVLPRLSVGDKPCSSVLGKLESVRGYTL